MTRVPALFRILAFAGVAYAGLLLVLFLVQRRLLYFPAVHDAAAATAAARRAGLEPWLARGRFLGWRSRPQGAPRALALVLHGNAGSALDRTYLRDVLASSDVPIDVRLVEYPGYGPRSGSPTERSLVGAAIEAIEETRGEGRPLPVVMVGESLGGAVASLAAAERPDAVRGLLLVTPLTNVRAVARRHYPFVPSFVIRDGFAADAALHRFPGRVVVLVAGRDEVVFPDLGRALFDAFPGEKRLWVQPEAGHNDVSYDPLDPAWRDAVAFLLRDDATR